MPADTYPRLCRALREAGIEGLSARELADHLGVTIGALQPHLAVLRMKGQAERTDATRGGVRIWVWV